MAKMMLGTTTANSTSIHFGMYHLFHKNNVLFTLEHIEDLDKLVNCNNIRKFLIKNSNIYSSGRKRERLLAIAEFTSLTMQMKNLVQ